MPACYSFLYCIKPENDALPHQRLGFDPDGTMGIDCLTLDSEADASQLEASNGGTMGSVFRRILAIGVAFAVMVTAAPAASAQSPSTPPVIRPIAPPGPSGGSPTTGSPCPYWFGVHYGFAYTARSYANVHCNQGTSTTPYYGWNGIEGTITAPAGSISGIGSPGHVAAWIGVLFTTYGSIQIGWAQGGWPAGSGCGNFNSPSAPHIFMESQTDGNCGNYIVDDVGPMPSTAYFTIYYAGNGCWEATVSTGWSSPPLCGFPNSGEAEAALELVNSDGATVPATNFGGSSSGALQLHGANGWILWNSSIYYSTATYDERYNTYPCVLRSDHISWYYVLTDARPTGC